MAIFIKIQKQVYKLPNKIVVGRGTPFGNLDPDRQVSRSHFVLKRSQGKIYLKDLGSGTGTEVNGQKLKPNRFFPLQPSDAVVFGGSKMELLEAAPEKDFIEIKQTTMSNQTNVLMTYGLEIFIALTLIILCVLAPGQILANILTGLMLYGVAALGRYVMGRITPDGLVIKEVYVSKEGFTVHFLSGKNMTFKFKDIQSWSFVPNGKKVSVLMYDQWYRMLSTGEPKELIEFLEAHASEQREQPKSMTPYSMGILGLGIICFITHNDASNWYLTLPLSLILTLVTCAMMANRDLREHWPVVVNRINSSGRQLGTIVFVGLFSCFMSYQSIQHKKNYALMDKCSVKDLKSCQQIDYSHFNIKADVNVSMVKLACEHKNESACQMLNFRSLASENK